MIRDASGSEFYFYNFIKQNRCVLFFYPKMGKNGEYLSDELKNTKGLTGCTLQAKGYVNLTDEYLKLGYKILAVGTQTPQDQEKFKNDIGGDILFINDEKFLLAHDLNLSEFSTLNGVRFYHRQTLIIDKGEILHRHIVTDVQNDAINTLEILKKLV
ncbi:hypothetical protein LMG7974_00695 [Campylobacter majalis]|uniref:Alkyl hydroperoxide reductase subunit C/ Thiol specific antioxidant domain-containing protein n=1 Tax=Campylobacter majalis TaxID=2790656 RepID=A0ABN7K5R1_9BACT|nr:redoxin domain-containing protein [Campylobacter majalis]CAD7287807.1 hypothetical protein LMG7974_00695 [Campylobacter majalis]